MCSHNKAFKRSSALARFARLRQRYAYMKLLIAFVISILLMACSKELPIVGEVPVTNGCKGKAIEQINKWNEDFRGTRIELKGEYIEFSKTDHAVSPVSGYVRLRAGNLDATPELYINSLIGLCLYGETAKIERDRLGYRVLNEYVARNIESGASELYIQVSSNEVSVSKHRGN